MFFKCQMFMSNIRLVAWSITKQSLFLSDDAHGPSCWRCALERIELRYQTNGQIMTSWCKPIQLGASWFHARLDIPSGLYGARPCKTLIFTSASLGSSDCKTVPHGLKMPQEGNYPLEKLVEWCFYLGFNKASIIEKIEKAWPQESSWTQ